MLIIQMELASIDERDSNWAESDSFGDHSARRTQTAGSGLSMALQSLGDLAQPCRAAALAERIGVEVRAGAERFEEPVSATCRSETGGNARQR